MKATKFDGEALTAYGKKLDKAVKYSGTFDAYEGIEEVKAANDILSDKEIVDTRNAERKAKAVTEARSAALEVAGIKAPEKDDPQVLIASLIKTYTLLKKPREVAIQMAEEAVGAKWEGQ
jgi:hypothetical protein